MCQSWQDWHVGSTHSSVLFCWFRVSSSIPKWLILKQQRPRSCWFRCQLTKPVRAASVPMANHEWSRSCDFRANCSSGRQHQAAEPSPVNITSSDRARFPTILYVYMRLSGFLLSYELPEEEQASVQVVTQLICWLSPDLQFECWIFLW